MPALPTKQTGFTLVELVMVIILIGILSYGASSLFANRDAYASFIAKDQLISQALLGQQLALGGIPAGDGQVNLSVGVSGGDWVFTLTQPFDPAITTDDIVIVREQSASGGSLVINGTTIASGSSQTFTWDNEGELVGGNNYEIRFVGDSSYRVCLSASGYAYDKASACP